MVKGLEYGHKSAPALLVLQVSCSRLCEHVSFARTGEFLKALFLCYLIIALQEWWGINEDIKEKALMLHQQGGCRVFIPDIFKGKTTVEIAEAKHVRSQPDFNQVLLSPSSCCFMCCLLELTSQLP